MARPPAPQPPAPRPAGSGTGADAARTGRETLAVALGVAGELLLTLAVLVGLFLVWQLWWTDVAGARAQDRVVAALDWPDPPPGPATAQAAPAGLPPVLAEPAVGTTFATLEVPRWGDGPHPVSQGTDPRTVLDVLGIGHYEGSAMPGGTGNFAVAGHRTTYGRPFARVEELVIGDPLVVRTEEAWFVYRVTGTSVVAPDEVAVVAPVPGEPGAAPTQALMTLTTCHPMYSARERFVVHATLDHWLPVSAGTPTVLGEA